MSTTDPIAAAERELAHVPPTDVEDWQESLVLTWYDEASGCGGFHRVGHEPNRGVGNLWCGVFTPDGRVFRRDLDRLPLGGDDRSAPEYGIAGQRFSWDGRLRLQVRDAELELDLEVEDHYPLGSLWHDTGASSVAASTIADHLESSGRVRGTLVLDGERYEIDGLAHRDHSWGPRDWSTVLSHRWVAGTCGPDLAFSVAHMQGPDGRFLIVAGVMRNGELVVTEDVDVVTWGEPDGVSHRGGVVSLGLPGEDERLELTCELVQGWVFDQDELAEVDAVCRVTSSTGHTGFCDFEVSNGARAVPVPVALRAVTHDGLGRG